VIEEMRSEGINPNKYTYASAIDACAMAAPNIGAESAAEMVESLLAAMRRDDITASQIHYNSLLKGCALAAKRGDSSAVDVAYRTLRNMRIYKVMSLPLPLSPVFHFQFAPAKAN
jgi:hypothetical protein